MAILRIAKQTGVRDLNWKDAELDAFDTGAHILSLTMPDGTEFIMHTEELLAAIEQEKATAKK